MLTVMARRLDDDFESLRTEHQEAIAVVCLSQLRHLLYSYLSFAKMLNSSTSIDGIIDQLTPRRRSVLDRLLTGASDEQIAQDLQINEATVRKHIERICESFAQALGEQHTGKFKRSDLIRLVAGQMPALTLPKDELSKESKELTLKGRDEYSFGNFSDAIRYFQAAIALRSDNDVAYYNMGLTYERLQQEEEAKRCYEAAIQLEGEGTIAAFCNLARLNILDNQPKQAIQILEPCLNTELENPSVKVAVVKNLGWAWSLLGEYDIALDYLKQAIALDDESTPSYCLMAQIFEKQQDFEQAESYCHKCLEGQVASDGTTEWRPEVRIWKTLAFQFLQTH